MTLFLSPPKRVRDETLGNLEITKRTVTMYPPIYKVPDPPNSVRTRLESALTALGMAAPVRRRCGVLQVRPSAILIAFVLRQEFDLFNAGKLPFMAPTNFQQGERRRSAREHLAANLVVMRRSKNWSQEDLALEAGLHRTFVAHVERGVRNISLDNIEKLAAAFDVETYRLLRPRASATE